MEISHDRHESRATHQCRDTNPCFRERVDDDLLDEKREFPAHVRAKTLLHTKVW